MVVSLKTDLRFPIPGQQGYGDRIIHQSIPHTLQHQEISTFRSVTHALVVSQQTHAVMFLLLLYRKL